MSVTFEAPKFSKYVEYGLRSSSNSPSLQVPGKEVGRKSDTKFRRRVSFDTITSDVPIGSGSGSGGGGDGNYLWYSSANNSSTALSGSPPVSGGFSGLGGFSGSGLLRSFSPPPYDASLDFGISGLYSNSDMVTSGNGGNSGNSGLSGSTSTMSANLRDYMKDKDMSSFVVQSRHKDYKTSISSRTILFSLTSKDYSEQSLKWTVKNLLEDGDELVCLKTYHSTDESDSISADYGKRIMYQKKAEGILESIVNIVDGELKINIIVELGIGKVKAMALKTLLLYQPSIVVVGTSENSFSNLARMRYKKTVSSYLIARSPVPVIIVSPTRMTSTNREGNISSGGLVRRSFSITPSMSPTDSVGISGASCSPIGTGGSGGGGSGSLAGLVVGSVTGPVVGSIALAGSLAGSISGLVPGSTNNGQPSTTLTLPALVSTTSPLSTTVSATTTASSTQPPISQKRRRSSTGSDEIDSVWSNSTSGSLAYYNYISSAIKSTATKEVPRKKVTTAGSSTAIVTIPSSPISLTIPTTTTTTTPLTNQDQAISPLTTTINPPQIPSPSTDLPLPPSITFAESNHPSSQTRKPIDNKTRQLLLRRRSADDTPTVSSLNNSALRLSPSLSSDAATSGSSSTNSSNVNLSTPPITPTNRSRRASSTTSNLARQTIKWTAKLSPSFLIPKSYRRNS